MSRLLAIGDIHGCRHALDTLLSVVKPTLDDTLVTLGDYIDRGPDSKGVIARLIDLMEETDLIPLRGNHEIMMIESREKRGEMMDLWLLNGGDATLDSYDAKTFDDIPAVHWDFLDNCLGYWETKTHLFVHAGLDPEVPMFLQSDIDLFWQHLTTEIRHPSGRPIICGHTPQRSGLPWVSPGTICIDTAACRGLWLTCLDVLSGQCWQANENGETRQTVIDFTGQTAITF